MRIALLYRVGGGGGGGGQVPTFKGANVHPLIQVRYNFSM